MHEISMDWVEMQGTRTGFIIIRVLLAAGLRPYILSNIKLLRENEYGRGCNGGLSQISVAPGRILWTAEVDFGPKNQLWRYRRLFRLPGRQSADLPYMYGTVYTVFHFRGHHSMELHHLHYLHAVLLLTIVAVFLRLEKLLRSQPDGKKNLKPLHTSDYV
jgi:hypothetical protein